uniref:Uncharacterized protein n=1 Tax=Timema cristinae TaxID=61476 RepID=A0A7R9DAD7_TIMCR|nr:unnamed protein product [Timema cristinae]
MQFTEEGICRADGDWFMDYWDPYGLDEGLLGSITMGVPTSTPLEAPQQVRASHDGIKAPRRTRLPPQHPQASSRRCPYRLQPPLFGQIWTPLKG